MNVLFLGSLTDDNRVHELSGSSFAGNHMQLAMLTEMSNILSEEIDVLSVKTIAHYPKDKILFSRLEYFRINNLNVFEPTFLNIPLVKQVNQAISLFLMGLKLSKEKNYDIIIAFNLYPQIGIPTFLLSHFLKLPYISILADLPIEDSEENLKKRGLMNIFNHLTLKLIKKSENLIVLNEHVIKEFSLSSNYIIIQGGVDSKEIEDEVLNYENRDFAIMYSGALTNYNGVDLLIESFNIIKDQSLILEIYGDGSLKKYVLEQSKLNSNIKYYGSVSNTEVKKRQKEVLALINPRKSKNQISRLTFPSKIFEYLLSGTVIISTRLNGFTEEYFDKMYFFNTENTESMANTIRNVINLPKSQLYKKAKEAKAFVIEEKNWNRQSIKIIDFINKVINKGNKNVEK